MLVNVSHRSCRRVSGGAARPPRLGCAPRPPARPGLPARRAEGRVGSPAPHHRSRLAGTMALGSIVGLPGDLAVTDRQKGHIEGYAIVSEDGMLATADLVMPDSLKFDADRRFFEQGLDGVDVVVHGRHSLEEQTHSASRRRIVLTRGIPSIERHSSNERALWWNPAGASFDEALTALGIPEANVGVIGGPDVFVLFLERYNAFYLSRAPHVLLPGGRPVFPGVPARRPEEILASHGLVPFAAHVLDAAKGVTMVPWRRAR